MKVSWFKNKTLLNKGESQKKHERTYFCEESKSCRTDSYLCEKIIILNWILNTILKLSWIYVVGVYFDLDCYKCISQVIKQYISEVSPKVYLLNTFLNRSVNSYYYPENLIIEGVCIITWREKENFFKSFHGIHQQVITYWIRTDVDDWTKNIVEGKFPLHKSFMNQHCSFSVYGNPLIVF